MAHKIGVGLLIFGVFLLLLGIIIGLTNGTYITPFCIGLSVLVNTVGIMLLQKGRRK
jgi:hypothetical protein